MLLSILVFEVWIILSLMLRIANRKEMVRKVRAGYLTDGRHAPCIFPVPPASPEGGIPDRPPLKMRCAGIAPGHSSAPALSRSLHSPCRAQARASPAISAAPWTGTALAFPRAAFSFHKHPRPPAPGEARATPAPDGSVMSLAAVRNGRAGLPGCHAACR